METISYLGFFLNKIGAIRGASLGPGTPRAILFLRLKKKILQFNND